MKTFTRKTLLAIAFSAICMLGNATDYYVAPAPSGQNSLSHDGLSPGQAWQTIEYALQRIGTGNDATLHVAAGTYTLANVVHLWPQISVIGAGTSTIIKLNSSAWYTTDGTHPDHAMIQVDAGTSTNRQILANFAIDGDSKHVWGGIYINGRDNVELYGLDIRNTYYTGVWLAAVSNSSLHDSYFQNCAFGNYDYESGAIELGRVEYSDLYNLTISEGVTGSPSTYGYGMKAQWIDTSENHLTHVTVHNCEFTTNPVGIWHNDQNPNIALEWWGCKLMDCEIYENIFHNTVSLVNGTSTRNAKGTLPVRVHHNTFTDNGGHYYALELVENYAEVDHNHFDGGPHPFAIWGETAMGWSIHHNTFINTDPVTWAGTGKGTLFMLYHSNVHNVKFYNNSCYINSSTFSSAFMVFETATLDTVDVKNNIFTSVSGATPTVFETINTGGTISHATVSYNCFNNFTPGSTGTVTSNLTNTNPMLVAGSATQPDPFFRLQSGSPCINAGTNVGYSGTDTQPDMGAYDHEGDSQTEVIDFGGEAAGVGTVNNSLYTDVAGVAVTFTDVLHYDGSDWRGDDDHTPNSRMGWFDESTSPSMSFSAPVQVSSLWFNFLNYGTFGAAVTGKLNGVTVWSKTIPGASFGTWYNVTDGAGKTIDEVVFTSADNCGIDDITIFNPGTGARAASKPSNATVVSTSVEEPGIFPNPVKPGQTLRVILPGPGKLTLMELSGRVMRHSDTAELQTEIATDGLSGLYLLKVECQQVVRTLKVVVK